MVQRVTLKRRHGWATQANKYQLVRTPGNRLVVQYVAKKHGPVTAPARLGGQVLHGLKSSIRVGKLSKNQRTVARAYGGVLTAGQVRDRIIRSFLIEEQKIVKRVLKAQAEKEAANPVAEVVEKVAEKKAEKPKAARPAKKGNSKQ